MSLVQKSQLTSKAKIGQRGGGAKRIGNILVSTNSVIRECRAESNTNNQTDYSSFYNPENSMEDQALPPSFRELQAAQSHRLHPYLTSVATSGDLASKSDEVAQEISSKRSSKAGPQKRSVNQRK